MAHTRVNSLPELQEEIRFLEDELAKRDRVIKHRDNKIKRLQQKLSENLLRARLERQAETIREQGEYIQRLKREKAALHNMLDERDS